MQDDRKTKAQLIQELQALRNLATQLQTRQEEERTRLAHEIYNELAPTLTVLHMDLAWFAKRLQTAPAAWRTRLQAMMALLTTLLSAMRRLGTELRPGILDDLGLCAAIEWHLQEVQKRTGLAYTLTLPTTEVSLQPGQATAVFRIVQEAVTNVLRHAEANTVAVHVVEHPDGLLVTIRDNGRGITPAQLADGASLGLLNMRGRAQLCGGNVTIVGLPGVGTTVTVLIPFVPVVSKGTPDDPHSCC